MENGVTTPFQIDSKTAKSILNWIESGYLFSHNGTIYSWKDPTNNSTPFEYYEITGYFLTLTSYLFQLKTLSKDSLIARQAFKAVDHLNNSYINTIGGFPYKNDSNISYSFDNMIIAFGLINFHNTFESEKALNLAIKICDDFIEKWINDCVISHKDFNGNIKDSERTWSTFFGGFHLKSNMALISLYQLTKNKKYLNTSIELSNLAIEKYYKNNTFDTYRDGGTHLHPLLYTIEGLMYKDLTLEEHLYKEEIESSLNWIYNQNKNTLFRSIKNQNIYFNMRTDIYFQLLRVLKLARTYYEIDLPFNNEEIEKEASQFQLDKSVFTFGLDSNGNKVNHLTSWVNFMALQYYVDKEKNNFQLLREFLV
jgi:hypothetical protein